MTRDDATLWDLIRAARLAAEFAATTDEESFEDDALVQSAVLHQLMVMGEAVKRLSAEVREAHAEIPWRYIARMRDRLIHGYDDVDLNLVWQTVTVDVPDLLAQIEPLLPDL